MSTTAVATAAAPAAEASHVTLAAKATRVATTAEVSERVVMPLVTMMLLPRMAIIESRCVASTIVRPSIGVGRVAVARGPVVAISRFATSDHQRAEHSEYQRFLQQTSHDEPPQMGVPLRSSPGGLAVLVVKRQTRRIGRR